MNRWDAVRLSSDITTVAFDVRESRIYVHFRTDMCATVRRLLARFSLTPGLGMSAVELFLQHAEVFATTEVE